MSLFVIEGDNGTGKDTLAIKLQEKFGFRVVTNEKDIAKLNKEAKGYTGKIRVKKFLEYGKTCSDIARKSKQDTLLVRYWISTLAAAYADDIFTYEQVCKIRDEICLKFYKPSMIICLSCDFDKRINRIAKRKSEDFDDVTKSRSDRYRWFLNEMQKGINVNWINVDTSKKDADQVFEDVSRILIAYRDSLNTGER